MEEPVIDHDILKTHAFNNAPKYWFEFVKNFLYNTIKKDNHQIGTKLLAKKAKQLMMKAKIVENLVPNCDDYKISRKCHLKTPHPAEERLRDICLRFCHNCGKRYDIRVSETRTHPTGHVVLSRAQVRNIASLYLKYELFFRLHTNLRMNITLTHVHLYAVFNSHKCQQQKLEIQTYISSLDNELYCGLLSNFVTVPRKPSFHIQIEVKKHNLIYHVDFTFSVTDPERVVTCIIQCRKYYNKPLQWIVYFPKTAIFLHRFIVKVEFLLILKFILASEMRKTIDIYDGPGTLCPKLKPFMKTDTNITYITSSFQSIIYLKSPYPNATKYKVCVTQKHCFKAYESGRNQPR